MNLLRFIVRRLNQGASRYPSLHRSQLHCQFSVFGGILASKIKDIDVDNFVNIYWDTDGKKSRFPFVFLREKCPCHSCFHESSQQRILHMRNLDINSKPVSTKVKHGGEKVEILWNDGHFSEFHSKFLFEKIIPESNRPIESIIREDAQIWDKGLEIQTFDFESMLRDEKRLLEWLIAMRQYGVGKVTQVPRKLGQVERFGKVLGYLKNTFYG